MESTPEGLSLRQMKLKILYTFDAENRNNCLARPPGIVDVHTAMLDEATEIGVIDLRTCALAIAQASPELIGSNINDYTIYAYDYSEPDTPLAGQGMLSWALASSDDSSDDLHAGKMITGRVTRNLLGLFSRNATETLEVKLRLTPVPGKTQGEYLNSLQRYQELSNVVGQGFDAQAWTSFIQANPTVLSATIPQSQAQPVSASPSDGSGLEDVQRMLSGDHSSSNRSRPGSRSGTPGFQSQNMTAVRQGSTQSRPNSRASIREGSMQVTQGPQQRRESFNSGYISGDDVFEEGPSKKRAKLSTANWQGKPEFNIERQPDSLRVVASTAASVRLHRPVPYNPAAPAQEPLDAGNEEPIRPPTPIPAGSRAPMRRAATMSSGLRRQSMVRSSSPYMPPPDLVMEQSSAGSGCSPERHSEPSVSSTPVNMPSSPPVIAGQTSTNSSPVLPPLHKDNDSGFMSGAFDDLFDDGTTINFNDDLSQLPNFDLDKVNDDDAFLENGTCLHPQAEQQQNSEPTKPAEMQPPFTTLLAPPGNNTNAQAQQSENLAQRQETSYPNLQPAPVNTQPAPNVQTTKPAPRSGFHSPRLAPAPVPRARQMQEEMKSMQSKGRRLASDPVGPPLQRAQTWTGGMSDLPQSDASLQLDATNKANLERKRKPGKEQTQARLEAAVKTGQVPPICDNCGTIDTPCWRKAWSKLFGGGFDLMEVSNKVGQFVGKEVIERDEKGEVKLFRAYKLQKGTGDKDCDFEPVNLCNSCGLWLQKRQCMRPESRWNKNFKDPNDKGKRPTRPRSQRNAARKGKKGDTSKSDAPTEPASSPDEGSDGAQASENEENGQTNDTQKANEKEADDSNEPSLPPLGPPSRAATRNSDNSIATDTSKAVDRRQVKSSPIRPPGSDINGPIEIDLTPKPLRRQLFSSPTKPPSMGHHSEQLVLTEISPNIVRRSPRLNKTRHIAGLPTKTPSPASKTQSHIKKTPLRNQQPADDLEDLFMASDDENSFPLPPQTPTPSRRSNRLLTKTPSKTPSHEKSTDPAMTPSQKRLLKILRTPKGKAQLSQHPTAAALIGQASHNIGEMTPFTRQIHEILTDPAMSSSFSPQQRSNNIPTLDFPDLPSLQGSSPNQGHHNNHHMNVDFSEFTHLNSDGLADPTMSSGVDLNELISTDVPMPSSPPLMRGGGGLHDDPFVDLGGDGQSRRRISPRRKNQQGAADLEGFDSGIGMMMDDDDESQFVMGMGMDMGDVDFQSLIDQAFLGQCQRGE